MCRYYDRTGVNTISQERTLDAFGKALADGCGKVASACSCDVSPIAKAFEAAAGDGIQMYYPDNHHQSQYGSYLKACVNYLMIYGEAFNEDASDCGLSPAVTSRLRKIAEPVVL